MSKVWKNAVGVVLLIGVCVGAAMWGTSYMMDKKISESGYTVDSEYGFVQQPFYQANYSLVAAENIDFTVAAESAVHAVVHIKSTTTVSPRSAQGRQYVDPFEYFFGFGDRGNQNQPRSRSGSGSGVIISVDGYIMTNNHVVEGADELEVTLNDNRKFQAKIVGTDPQTDIALIKIEAKDLPTMPFGDSDALKVGEWVLAVGNPFNLTSTVTAGIVSAKSRGGISRSFGAGSVSANIESFIQTDAAVNPGNSGGALVNTKGELVGINTAIYSETGNFAGYSFAVPISIAGKVAADLKQFGTVQRALLGVQMVDVPDMERSSEEAVRKDKVNMKVNEGAYIAEFTQSSAAKQAGVEIGDVIVAVNDTKVRTGSSLQEQISKYRPGDKVKITVDRYGAEKTFTVELRNAQGNTDIVKGVEAPAVLLGAAFKELSDRQKQQFGISYGVEVAEVNNGKIKDAGITKGYIILTVNDQRISTPDELDTLVERVLRGSEEEKILVIKGVYPTGRTKYYVIDLTE
ncbi:Do family serine endopeptidase [Parabacteroides sp. OttesenSCG-928-G21]|nr:Do family serine endopeptidase [Parabacteroides sp. OttesenSCG-928-G21]